MCEFYVSADPILYESRTRTVRIRGVSTSIRLENFIWDTLANMAKDEGMTTNALIVTFHDEILQSRGDVQNFTSFLRVTCLRYLDRKCEQLAVSLSLIQSQARSQVKAKESRAGRGSYTQLHAKPNTGSELRVLDESRACLSSFGTHNTPASGAVGRGLGLSPDVQGESLAGRSWEGRAKVLSH